MRNLPLEELTSCRSKSDKEQEQEEQEDGLARESGIHDLLVIDITPIAPEPQTLNPKRVVSMTYTS